MPIRIKIIKQGDDLDDQYTAEVTASNGTWRSPNPMPGDELGKKLISLGHDPVEVRHALHAAGVGYCPKTLKLARITRPLLQAALAGEREVPKQEPHTEAWLAYALPRSDMMYSLIQVIGDANFTMDGYPTPDEICWAFVRLRRRGWLIVEGEMYGLTPEAKRIIKEIEYDNRRWPRKLIEWMSEHPLPGDE
jgi:hypothetical protein